jgi:hypothetical protein
MNKLSFIFANRGKTRSNEVEGKKYTRNSSNIYCVSHCLYHSVWVTVLLSLLILELLWLVERVNHIYVR